MHKKKFIALCTLLNSSFIALQIYKHTQFVQSTYKKQAYEHAIAEHMQHKEHLTQQLHALQDRNAIQKFAQEKLGMKRVSLRHIKQLKL